jgi:hypothetical protein
MSALIQFLSFGAGLIVAGLGLIAAVYLASPPPRPQDGDDTGAFPNESTRL